MKQTREFERKHQAKRLEKLEKIQTLKALVETHEQSSSLDFDYLRGLRQRLRSVECQYRAMKI